MSELTAERLRELLHYDPETGEFTRKMRAARIPAGSKANSVDTSNGYVKFRVDGKRYFAHRLAWLYMHGRWPNPIVDHIDGNKTNNRIGNLREATDKANAQNRRAAGKNKVYGTHLGVEPNTGKKKPWTARIFADGKRHYLGCYETEEEAHAVYLAAKRRLHEGCTI